MQILSDNALGTQSACAARQRQLDRRRSGQSHFSGSGRRMTRPANRIGRGEVKRILPGRVGGRRVGVDVRNRQCHQQRSQIDAGIRPAHGVDPVFVAAVVVTAGYTNRHGETEFYLISLSPEPCHSHKSAPSLVALISTPFTLIDGD